MYEHNYVRNKYISISWCMIRVYVRKYTEIQNVNNLKCSMLHPLA